MVTFAAGLKATLMDFSNWCTDDGFKHTANAGRTWLRVCSGT